jgi:hypothetical protein
MSLFEDRAKYYNSEITPVLLYFDWHIYCTALSLTNYLSKEVILMSLDYSQIEFMNNSGKRRY